MQGGDKLSFVNFVTTRLKKVVRKLQGNLKIEDVINTGIITSEMNSALNLWGLMYEDKAPWLKEPSDDDLDKVVSLGIPSFIASEKARMATLEMKSTITLLQNNSEDSNFLNEQYQQKVISKIRTQLEYGIAKGGLVIKPYLAYDKNTKQAIKEFEVEFIQADGFFPIAFDSSGKMTEGAFIQRKVDKEYAYSRLEHHKLVNNTVIITNSAFRNNINQTGTINNISDLGKKIPLTDVPEWANIQPIQEIENVDRLLFAYFKMPEANTIDTYSPLGVSGYSRAVNLIEEADKQYSRLLWEFEGGELAIDADRNVLKEREFEDFEGIRHYKTELAKRQARLYRTTEIDATQELYQVFNPNLRDVSFINGLNTLLMRIEDVCSLSRGTLSEVTSEARTATELKIMKQRSYSANADIQKSLEKTLRDVFYIMNVYCTLYEIIPNSEYDISFEWDDSLIVDVDTELQKRIELMQNGLESKLKLRMWYFGETEDQARQALREIAEENKQDMEETLMNDTEN